MTDAQAGSAPVRIGASQAITRDADKPVSPWANARLLGLGLVVYYVAMLVLMERRLHWTPRVLPASAPPALFSEGRAMAHVHALAGELPDRQISMPQLRKAHDYIVRQGEILAGLAAARGGDVDVQVYRETATGSVAMEFTGAPFTNAYLGLTNIVVTLTPSAARGRRGLLIAAHHDTAVAAPGAADDVSMVAVMLEAARTLLARPTSNLPAAPLVLLFDGGEESICQAGHGFFNSSPHARGLGAFVNLEAMGAGGLPILFQHTGAWTVAAWAKGAPNAHGARIAQDIFDTGVIPGDTDYRMFSARHYGTLPGLDIAFIRDSVAYHSSLDNVDRLRKGALQDMGEALLGGLMSLTARLAADTKGELQAPKALRERAVFFDLIGCGMVSYPDSVARQLHTLPLALFLMMPLSAVAVGHTAAGVMTRMMAAAGRAVVAFLSALLAPALLGVLRVLVTGVSMSWYAHHWAAYAMFLPLGFAAAVRPWIGLRREAMERRPWQQGHHVACEVYGVGLVLSALAAGLCVGGLQGFSQVLALGGMLAFVLGSLLDNGQPTLTPTVAAGALAVSTVPLAAMGAILGTFLDVMMERMALTGHHSVFLADGIIGVLTGSAILGYSCCSLLPLAGYALGGLVDFPDAVDASHSSETKPPSGPSANPLAVVARAAAAAAAAAKQELHRRQQQRREARLQGGILAALAATSLAAAAWSSYGMVPYNRDNPRRVTITHLHETGSWAPQDDVFPEAAARAVAAAVAATDVHPAPAGSAGAVQERPPSPEEERRALRARLEPPPNVQARLALGITDSNPWAQMFATGGPAASTAAAAAVTEPGDLPYVVRNASLTLSAARQLSSAFATGAVQYDDYAYASLYPLNRLLGKMVLEAEPAAEPPVAVPPYVRKVREEPGIRPDSSSSSRSSRIVHLRAFSEAHCWGMLNITTAAPLRSWSLPSAPVAAPLRVAVTSPLPEPPTANGQASANHRRTIGYRQVYYHMVRFSHEAESPFWDLWVEVEGGVDGGADAGTDSGGTDPWVIVELSATYLQLTPELRAVRDALPDWVTPTWIGTTYHSSYKF